MLMPSIFGENLFDDFFGDFPFYYDDRAMKDAEKKLYGHKANHVMKTDIKEMNNGYELIVDLPGFKKDEVHAALENGYLTISAEKGLDKDEKEKETGRYIRRERYAGACSRIDDFAYTPQQNIAHAMTTLMAQNRGAGKKDRVKEGFRCGIRIELVYAAGLTVVCFFGAEGIMRMFAEEPEVIELGARFLRLISLMYFLPALTNGIQGFFRGIGDLKITLRSSMLSMAARVPSAALLVLYFHMEIEAQVGQ